MINWLQWYDKNEVSLSHGDKVKHDNGDIETIYEAMENVYIEGVKSLFPLTEFSYRISDDGKLCLTEFVKID